MRGLPSPRETLAPGLGLDTHLHACYSPPRPVGVPGEAGKASFRV